jgi:hypothetical protein
MLEIIKEYEEDCQLSEVELHDKSMKIPGMKSKWLKIYYEEQKLLSTLEEKQINLQEEYAMKYKDKSGKQLPLHILKHKIQEHTEQDERLQKLAVAIKAQKEVVRFCKELLDLVKNIGFDIKNCVSILELESR